MSNNSNSVFSINSSISSKVNSFRNDPSVSTAKNSKMKSKVKLKHKVEGDKVDEFITETKKFLTKASPPVNSESTLIN